MNSILLYLTIILSFGICFAEQEYPFSKCPTPKLPILEPFSFNKFLGTWFALRGTPCEDEPKVEMDCASDTYWTDAATNPTLNLLMNYRVNGSIQGFFSGTINVTHLSDGLVDNKWTINMMGFSMPSLFVETDNGHSWLIWHTCQTMDETKPPKPIWLIMSRTRAMDAKLMQTLVEKVEKYSGLTGDKLQAINQANCH